MHGVTTESQGAKAPLAGAGELRVLLTADQIASRVRALGLEIARDYDGERPLLVAVLKGACMFQADLARASALDLELDFLLVSSYGSDTTAQGPPRLISDVRGDVAGRHVLLCEGVVDSGRTVSYILDALGSRRPASLVVAALLNKLPCRKIEVPLRYVGFSIGADFVVGYGLDRAERYRNLPFIGIPEEM